MPLAPWCRAAARRPRHTTAATDPRPSSPAPGPSQGVLRGVLGRLHRGRRAAQRRLDLRELPPGPCHRRVDRLRGRARRPSQLRQRLGHVGGVGGVGAQPVGSQVHAPIVLHGPPAAGPIAESRAGAQLGAGVPWEGRAGDLAFDQRVHPVLVAQVPHEERRDERAGELADLAVRRARQQRVAPVPPVEEAGVARLRQRSQDHRATRGQRDLLGVPGRRRHEVLPRRQVQHRHRELPRRLQRGRVGLRAARA